mgnify:FL=1
MKSGSFHFLAGVFLILGLMLLGRPVEIYAIDRTPGYDSSGNYIDEVVIDEALNQELAAQRLQQKHDEYVEKIKNDPDNYLYHFYLGNLYLELDRPHEAVAAFKETLLLKPRDGKVHYQMGKAYSQAKNNEKAVEHIETAGRIFKENLDLHWQTKARNLLRQVQEQN